MFPLHEGTLDPSFSVAVERGPIKGLGLTGDQGSGRVKAERCLLKKESRGRRVAKEEGGERRDTETVPGEGNVGCGRRLTPTQRERWET